MAGGWQVGLCRYFPFGPFIVETVPVRDGEST